MFRISRYALAHSFAHKHRFHRSRSPLRPPSVPPLSGDGSPLQPMFMNEILHQFISTNFEHLLMCLVCLILILHLVQFGIGLYNLLFKAFLVGGQALGQGFV